MFIDPVWISLAVNIVIAIAMIANSWALAFFERPYKRREVNQESTEKVQPREHKRTVPLVIYLFGFASAVYAITNTLMYPGKYSNLDSLTIAFNVAFIFFLILNLIVGALISIIRDMIRDVTSVISVGSDAPKGASQKNRNDT